uniref:Spt4/RpoE2 zinc finger domain-containing protein n=1 Tax=Leersia perrieri TaxID=77586 RepID=A0A0D9X1P1_9ORYZ
MRRGGGGGGGSDGMMEDEGRPKYAQIPTSFGHELRACLRCRLVKTYDQFMEQGCENCPFLEMDRDHDNVVNCTTPNFTGGFAKRTTCNTFLPSVYEQAVVPSARPGPEGHSISQLILSGKVASPTRRMQTLQLRLLPVLSYLLKKVKHWDFCVQVKHWGFCVQATHWGFFSQATHWGFFSQAMHWGFYGQTNCQKSHNRHKINVVQ